MAEKISTHIYLDTDDLAYAISRELTEEGVLEFVTLLDQNVASWDFTVKLYAALGDALRAEIEADPEGRME